VAGTNYEDYQAAIAPTFLQDVWGQAWLEAHGSLKDALVEQLKEAVKCRFPLLAPPDALQALGFERSIQRGLSESQSAYAQRVLNAWTAWLFGGTAQGVLSQLIATGYTSSVLMQHGLQYTMSAGGVLTVTSTGTRKSWEPGQPNLNAPKWSTFSLIIPHPWPAAWLSASNWASPIHIGAGTGTLTTFNGIPSPDVGYCVKISTGGATGTAHYEVSTDGGVTFGSATTLAASGNALGGGPTFSASGTFTLNDRYYVAQVPPTNSSGDANLVRKILGQWKPGLATCSSIIILETGRLIGYPIRNLGSSNGVLGGCSLTTWTPPT
jgi:hypothetical protein